jgi:hypothetical protein
MPQSGTIVVEQTLSVLVNGPNGTNTLFITTGLMNVPLSVNDAQPGAGVLIEDEFSAPLTNPTLTAAQFKSAIASASLAAIDGDYYNGSTSGAAWLVLSVGARFNAGTGRVELVTRLRVAAGYGKADFSNVGFQVFTTAAI